MNHFIREIYPQETARLAWLGGRLFWEAYKEVGDQQKIRSFIEHHYTAERFSQYLEIPSTRIYVWEEESEWYGYIMVNVPEPVEVEGKLLENAAKVNLLYIDAKYQGKGIGRQLLLEAEKVSRKANCEWLWLTVWPITKAPGFYRRMGLERMGDIPFVYPDGSEDTDWIMAKQLRSTVEEQPGQNA